MLLGACGLALSRVCSVSVLILCLVRIHHLCAVKSTILHVSLLKLQPHFQPLQAEKSHKPKNRPTMSLSLEVPVNTFTGLVVNTAPPTPAGASRVDPATVRLIKRVAEG
jgi:hypothetical protein